jgi:hypothetical protein
MVLLCLGLKVKKALAKYENVDAPIKAAVLDKNATTLSLVLLEKT